jgi:hypothetical protein
MSKCIFCKKPLRNIEVALKSCSTCVVNILTKRHNLKVRRQAPIRITTKKDGQV